jgi:hypothetical protein
LCCCIVAIPAAQDLCYDAWKIFKILQPTVHLTSRSLFPLSIQFRQQQQQQQQHAGRAGSSTPPPSSVLCSTSSTDPAEEKVGEGEKGKEEEGEGEGPSASRDDYDATAELDLVAVKHGWLGLLPLLLGLPAYYLKFYKYKSW